MDMYIGGEENEKIFSYIEIRHVDNQDSKKLSKTFQLQHKQETKI